MSAREELTAMFAPFFSGTVLEEAVDEAYALMLTEAADAIDASSETCKCDDCEVSRLNAAKLRHLATAPAAVPVPDETGGDETGEAPRCTCARSWGLHSKDCALYTPGHELASPAAELERLRAERDTYCDRVDTLTAVAKGNKRHVQEMYADLQKAHAERDELRELKRRVTEQLKDFEEGLEEDPGAPAVAHNMTQLMARAVRGDR